MKEIRTYHCNICGALLMQGDTHTCDADRIAIVDRIAEILGDLNHEEHEEHEN